MIRNPTATGTRVPSMAGRWSRKNLHNFKRGLGATDIVKLANGFLLFSVDSVDIEERTLDTEESWIFAYR